MDLPRGTEERGCVFRVKKTRIYVHLQLQNNSSSRRVLSEHQTVDLGNKYTTKDFLRNFRHGFTVHEGKEDRTVVLTYTWKWIREGTDLR